MAPRRPLRNPRRAILIGSFLRAGLVAAPTDAMSHNRRRVSRHGEVSRAGYGSALNCITPVFEPVPMSAMMLATPAAGCVAPTQVTNVLFTSLAAAIEDAIALPV